MYFSCEVFVEISDAMVESLERRFGLSMAGSRMEVSG
jgi:hypothetical protein